MDIFRDIDLRDRTTFGISARAACWVDYHSEDELRSLFGPDGADLPRPFFPIGGGSNLVPTGDFPGTLLHSCIRGGEVLEDDGDAALVEAGAGEPWDEFVLWACRKGLWGVENLSLIPGDVGAAAVQNIGAYGSEAGDAIVSVRCLDVKTLSPRTFTGAECAYGYRESFFKGEGKGRYIVLSLTFHLSRENGPTLGYKHLKDTLISKYGDLESLTPCDVRETVIAIRRTKLPDPAEIGSAGSYFRNPCVGEDRYEAIAAMGLGDVPHFPAEGGLVKIPAAWLIEKCGFKGARRGNVGVYEKQPLVIINATGEATPGEVLALEREICEAVKARFGVTLIPEAEHLPGVQPTLNQSK